MSYRSITDSDWFHLGTKSVGSEGCIGVSMDR